MIVEVLHLMKELDARPLGKPEVLQVILHQARIANGERQRQQHNIAGSYAVDGHARELGLGGIGMHRVICRTKRLDAHDRETRTAQLDSCALSHVDYH